jgi:hypothetical protein
VNSFYASAKSVNATSTECLSQRWKKCVDNEGDFVENKLNCVKNVSMIYLNFITIVIVVFESKIGSFTLVPTFMLIINWMVATPSLLFIGYQGILSKG